jgi:hypothetical protein
MRTYLTNNEPELRERFPKVLPVAQEMSAAVERALSVMGCLVNYLEYPDPICDECGRELTVEEQVKLTAEEQEQATPTAAARRDFAQFEFDASTLLDQLRAALRPASARPSWWPPAPAAGGKGQQKRSTAKGDAPPRLIAALNKHHCYDCYADGICLNQEPIGNNQLARMAGVAKDSASRFFQEEFGGHKEYKVMCRDLSKLVAALKLLNGDFAPRHLFGSSPPGEGHDTDE